ncbi:OLC1v1009488C1 [Oldenlandia corymbosa var. corymbosa]|uniref:Auxin efflux carrier component n=1 Tax=Oldenlandia corymbosa var. corymbosa TaxID=529605 RepID=A0AAV1DP98_OLDCO|nr:OLC1v1009488C1 [Oldenlandia corymbosa var. corymbosa]
MGKAMVSPTEVYHVVEALVPLYTAMILAYASVKWWKIFTIDQCSGINKFVARFSVPFLSFQVIATNNIYKMNVKLIFADLLQKILAFILLTLITKLSYRGGLRLNWVLTGVSLSTLPNTLVLGIPLLRAMYGVEAAAWLSQIVVLQSLIWYNLLLLLFELNATREVHHVTLPSAINREMVTIEEAAEKEEESQDEVRSRTEMVVKVPLKIGRKLVRNPNTHATLAGLIWSSIHFRYGVQLPEIVDRSISILSDGGLGMAVFSLGLFMASQAKLLACGTRNTLLALAMKFVAGPAIMAGCSAAVGMHGTLLKVAIVQAALPQGIVPFVFAKEYNIHPEILSTGIFLGLLMAMPVALAYYYVLSL